ncbi:MAG: glucose-6-phosphate dehydrogenase, partial [Neisseriaceae bacterium]|nr:glucose-6-phosphate dehydrogenase [Neisseriaceae bacterium]
RDATIAANFATWLTQNIDKVVNTAAPEWPSFLARLSATKLDANSIEDFQSLAQLVGEPTKCATVCYFSTSPNFFEAITKNLAQVGLNHPSVRLVVEKPLGIDADSSRQINATLAQYFSETQLYRIDHYLGKEAVQNLLALRFSNPLLEPLWRNTWVDSVQITVAETLGIEKRGDFYDGVGALRDMVQNHLLQLLCIVAMEPPSNLGADAVRDEKHKILKSLRPLTPETLAQVVRGQYQANPKLTPATVGYLEESGIPKDSNTETFVAMVSYIDNWRWAGVPFYLRTGKRLAAAKAEIVIKFKDVPHQLFSTSTHLANKMVITLQPEESVRLYFQAKVPGDDMRLAPVFLNLDFNEVFKMRRATAYERLLLESIRGNQTLFVRKDEVAAAWAYITPLLEYWQAKNGHPDPYIAGSFGPEAAETLLKNKQDTWHD